MSKPGKQTANRQITETAYNFQSSEEGDRKVIVCTVRHNTLLHSCTSINMWLENMAKFKFCQNKYTLTKKSRRRKNLYFS